MKILLHWILDLLLTLSQTPVKQLLALRDLVFFFFFNKRTKAKQYGTIYLTKMLSRARFFLRVSRRSSPVGQQRHPRLALVGERQVRPVPAGRHQVPGQRTGAVRSHAVRLQGTHRRPVRGHPQHLSGLQEARWACLSSRAIIHDRHAFMLSCGAVSLSKNAP